MLAINTEFSLIQNIETARTASPRRRSASLVLASAAALSLLGAGCSGGDEPTEQDYSDVATSVGFAVSGGELDSLSDTVLTAQGQTPFGLTSRGSGSYQGTRGNFSYEYEISCQGSDGAAMAVCDATTDTASASVDWSGNVDLDHLDLSIARSGQWTVTGLQSEIAVFNGQGSFDLSMALTSFDRRSTSSFVLAYDASYTNLSWDTATEVVTSGAIEYEIHVERTASGPEGSSDAEFDMLAEIEFDGSGNARLVLDGSHSYRIDLTSGLVTKE